MTPLRSAAGSSGCWCACRVAGDYGELLAHGHVVRQVEDADAWRAAIRAQARADRIEVRTGADGCAVHALVRRRDDDTGNGLYLAALKELTARAAALRHEPILVARHRSEILISCDRCPALGYADAEDHVIGGSLLEPAAPTRRNRGRRHSASCGRARREVVARPAETTASGVLIAQLPPRRHVAAAIVFYAAAARMRRRRPARCRGVRVPRVRSGGRASRRRRDRDGHRDVRVSGGDADLSPCEARRRTRRQRFVSVGRVFHHDGAAGLPVEGGLGRSGVPRRHHVPSAVVVRLAVDHDRDHPADPASLLRARDARRDRWRRRATRRSRCRAMRRS